jgi:hypothetical protein
MSETAVPIIAFLPRRWAAMPTLAKRELAQLAKTRSVFALETAEPIHHRGERECWELLPGAPDLLVCRPRVARRTEVGDPGVQTRMAKALLCWLDIDDFVAWLYSPSALACARSLAPSLLIHDRSFESPRTRE